MMPGLAANPKIFEFLKLPEDYEVFWMKWINPKKNETIQNYTQRLIQEQIHHPLPILLGVSFGGIIIREIAEQIPVKKLILVSTVKTHREFSPFFKKALQYKLYKFFPSRAMAYVDLMEKFAFTRRFKQKMKLYQKYMDVNEKHYLDWSIKTILHWQQNDFPTTDFIHIHGTKDKVFPIKYIKEPVIKIENGRHDMIIFKSQWFNRNWDKLLS